MNYLRKPQRAAAVAVALRAALAAQRAPTAPLGGLLRGTGMAAPPPHLVRHVLGRYGK